MSLLSDFKARFPEFATATVDQYVPILEPVLPAYYGEDYDPTNARNKEIVLNLTAHLIVMETMPGSASAQMVASKSVGSVSTSYQAATGSGGDLHDAMRGTRYGQRFLLLTVGNYGGQAV